jgi:hypothetical protein
MVLSLIKWEENVPHDFSSSDLRRYGKFVVAARNPRALNSLGIPPLSLRTIWFLEFSVKSNWGRG